MKASVGVRSIRFGAAALGLLVFAAPALAQFERVEEVPATTLFAVRANGDTIAAGADTAIYVSTDAGKHWLRSAKPAAKVAVIDAIVIRNHRLFIGTFGQGVFISDDLGTSWQAFNQGLVGGILDSQLDVSDLVVRGDSIYAATEGAGVYVRSLIGVSAWQPFGDAFEPNQASNVTDLALGGNRLLASAGGNGQMFFRDPGDGDWSISDLDNVGIHAGLQAQSAAFNGNGWVVGTSLGVFRSVTGAGPWALINLRLGLVQNTCFATQGSTLFAAFDIVNGGGLFAAIAQSDDDGASWQVSETEPNVFVADLAISGGELFAARGDGLFRRAAGTASVPLGGSASALRFALAGAQPFGDRARLRFELPEAGSASIEVFYVTGRRASDRIEGSWSAGVHEVSLDARRMGPGVYAARLTAEGRSEVVRLVHIR